MINSKELFQEFQNKLVALASIHEAESVSYLVLETILGLSRTDILLRKEIELPREKEDQLSEIADRLNKDEPVQYVLNAAWFLGHKFYVNPSVLIPRPETEELVKLILEIQKKAKTYSLLDIGTGSGCIPISIKKESPTANITAIDISQEALSVATRNAFILDSDINFIQHDILTQPIPIGPWDVIVSNPPYILESESASLHNNVNKHEPHLALFVPTDDPLLFYKAIAKKGFDALKPEGKIFMEINQRFGREVAKLLTTTGFENVEIKKDIFGNDRILTGMK